MKITIRILWYLGMRITLFESHCYDTWFDSTSIIDDSTIRLCHKYAIVLESTSGQTKQCVIIYIDIPHDQSFEV